MWAAQAEILQGMGVEAHLSAQAETRHHPAQTEEGNNVV